MLGLSPSEVLDLLGLLCGFELLVARPDGGLVATHEELVKIEEQIQEATAKHNTFLQELGLSPLPGLNAAPTKLPN